MKSRRMRILELLESGSISSSEAAQLLDTLGLESAAKSTRTHSTLREPKQVCVRIQSPSRSKKKINFRLKVPVSVLKTGIKLTSLLPAGGQAALQAALDTKGVTVDLKALSVPDSRDFEVAMRNLSIDTVDSNGNHVQVYWE